MAGQLSKLSANGQIKALREYQSEGLTQNAFTTLVGAIWARENQIDMFPETKLDAETIDKAKRFRKALDLLTREARQISDVGPDVLASAFAHEMGYVENLIDGAIDVLQKARRGIQRQIGRQRARTLAEVA